MEIEIKETVSRSEKKVVAVQLPYEVYLSLLDEAEEDFISVSDVMRRIIIRHYRSMPKKEISSAKFNDVEGEQR